ncbi:hypothetical protein GTO27_09020 [Candidatus Bathyarchaeota archaeon]|nr:hypothetical protein [Candidatus Bathyarchaeota archaeon]
MKTSPEKLMPLIEEIINMERKAKELYEDYLKRIENKSVVKNLTRILTDEKKHIELATQVRGLLKHGPAYSRIEEALRIFCKTTSLLIDCGIKNYLKMNLIVLKDLVNERGLNCLYVAVNKPSSSLTETFLREDIEINRFTFIDCTAMNVSGDIHLSAKPDNLTDLNMKIGRLVEKTPGEKFVFLDAVSTLYIFNSANDVERFVHYLVSSSKLKKTGLILVAVREEIEKRSMAMLTTFCDDKIDI